MNPSQVTELQEKVASLQEALLSSHPMIPVLLRNIHSQLRSDPEVVTLLTEDEIGIIVSGLKLQTATEISTTTVKNSSSSAIKKQIKNSGGTLLDCL